MKQVPSDKRKVIKAQLRMSKRVRGTSTQRQILIWRVSLCA